MTSKLTALTAVTAFCLVASQPSLATTIATSNLNDLLASAAPTFSSSWRAQSFTVANDQNYALTDVQIAVDAANANIFASIYSDNASHPGTLLEQLSFGSSASVQMTLTNSNVITASLMTFISSGLSLTAGSTYWVVGGRTSGGPTYWYGTNSAAETGLSGWSIANTNQFTSNSGASWSNSVANAQFMAIDVADPTAAVPEPSTLTLMGIAGLGLLRRRKAA